MSETSAPVPGPGNAITDVPGVLVGHHHRIEDGWATGSTVVLTPQGAVGAVDGRGGAPGTRETDLLAPENMVQDVHAVCLSGGSAYGLAVADGVMRWLAARNIGFPVGHRPEHVVPIVPSAVLFDLPAGDWGHWPDAEFGRLACENATAGGAVTGRSVMGCVGAGAGARLGSLKGGIGTASQRVGDFTVGALVAANAAGEAVDLDTGRPWAADLGLGAEFGGVNWPNRPGKIPDIPRTILNTTIGVVAVDAALTKAQARRLAMSAQDGLARAVRPAHSLFDGDTVFALATGALELPDEQGMVGGRSPAVALDQLCAAGADVFARAVVHGLLAATSVLAATSAAGLPAYRDIWPEYPTA